MCTSSRYSPWSALKELLRQQEAADRLTDEYVAVKNPQLQPVKN